MSECLGVKDHNIEFILKYSEKIIYEIKINNHICV